MGGGEDFFGWGALEYFALGQEGDLVGGYAGEGHLVGHEDQVAAFALKLLDHLEDLGSHLGVVGGGGFVEEEEAGLDGDGAGDGYALLLAAAELAGFFVGVRLELEALKGFQCACAGLWTREPVDFLERQHDVRKCVEMREEVVGLENGADTAAVLAEGFLIAWQGGAIDGDRAGVGALQAGEDAEECGFAATAGADEDEGVEGVQAEGDIIENPMGAEGLGYIGEFEPHVSNRLRRSSDWVQREMGRVRRR